MKTLQDVDHEIIFVDDNSRDKTYEIIKKISSKNPHVRCIRRIGRRGLSSAVIEGCLSSSSDSYGWCIVVIIDVPMAIDPIRRLSVDVIKTQHP